MIDISIAISPDMPTWPGDPPVSITPTARIAQGDPANVSRYCIGSHTGTHVDPPYHFLDSGITVDQLPLDVLVGEAQVVNFEQVASAIGAADLAGAGIPAGTERVLLKTRNSQRWASGDRSFTTDYVFLGDDGARWLVQQGVRLVGIDYLSIEGYQSKGHPVHHLLLSNGVIIVEGLNLSAARAGRYQLACLPLNVKGGDGGPARAVLL